MRWLVHCFYSLSLLHYVILMLQCVFINQTSPAPAIAAVWTRTIVQKPAKLNEDWTINEPAKLTIELIIHKDFKDF